MDTNKYEKNKDFDRNEAIYTLYSIDKINQEEIAANFQLTIDEVQKIIALHEKYETAMKTSG